MHKGALKNLNYLKRLDIIGVMFLVVDLKSVPFWSASSSLAEGTTK